MWNLIPQNTIKCWLITLFLKCTKVLRITHTHFVLHFCSFLELFVFPFFLLLHSAKMIWSFVGKTFFILSRNVIRKNSYLSQEKEQKILWTISNTTSKLFGKKLNHTWHIISSILNCLIQTWKWILPSSYTIELKVEKSFWNVWSEKSIACMSQIMV